MNRVFAAALVFVSACGPKPAGAGRPDAVAGGSDSAAVHRIVDSIDAAFMAAVERQDLEGVLSGYAPDYLDVQDGEILRGRDSLRTILTKMLPFIKKIEIQPVPSK